LGSSLRGVAHEDVQPVGTRQAASFIAAKAENESLREWRAAAETAGADGDEKLKEVVQAHALQDRAWRAAAAMARADGGVKAEEAAQAKRERLRARRAAAATARADI